MLLYLIQMTILWAVLALLYYILLRKTTFFALNRWYLLLSILVGIWLPWVPETGWEAPATATYTAWLPMVQVGLAQTTEWLWPPNQVVRWGLIMIYLVGVAVSLTRLFVGLRRIRRLRDTAERHQVADGSVLYKTASVDMPATFMGWIFWPARYGQNDLNAEQLAILKHEQAHQKGWHSVDIMFMELIGVVFWFHPLLLWYQSSLRLVHEYIADQAATKHSSRKQYGLLLIRHAQSGLVPALTHHFFQSPLKQRLIMLTQQHSGTWLRLRYLLLIPVLASTFWFCQTIKDDLASSPDALSKSEIVKLDGLDVLPEFPGGQAAMMQYLGSEVKYPQAARKAKTEGLTAIRFIVNRNGSIIDAEIVKDLENGCGAEALRVIKAMPDWTPGQKDGQPVKTSMVIPIKFKLD
jgi:TonB family protein